MEIQTLIEKLVRIYQESPNPAQDIERSGIVKLARTEWENVDEIIAEVERKAFEHICAPHFRKHYFNHALRERLAMGDYGFQDNGSYLTHKWWPYVENYINEVLPEKLPGWNWGALPLARHMLFIDIVVEQAVWEYRNSVSESLMRLGEWSTESTFIYELEDKDGRRPNFEEALGRHYTADGPWLRLADKKRVKPGLHNLFESLSKSESDAGGTAVTKLFAPPDF